MLGYALTATQRHTTTLPGTRTHSQSAFTHEERPRRDLSPLTIPGSSYVINQPIYSLLDMTAGE